MSDQTKHKLNQMVNRQIEARGVEDQNVIAAMKTVPREEFVPPQYRSHGYEDSPLTIGQGQTISQPYIVARMLELLELDDSSRLLEVGSGSGYAAAVAGQVAGEVYCIERHGELAERSSHVLNELGYDNIKIRHGNGYLGWPEKAPFDAILVSAGGREVPPNLTDQLKTGGILVIPVGEPGVGGQVLLRIRRAGENEFEKEEMGLVSFVPLLNSVADTEPPAGEQLARKRRDADSANTEIISPQTVETFEAIDDINLSGMLERIGDAKVVCIGEASHGTSEFYRLRASITQELIERKGFTVVAVEADWPDAAVVNSYVKSNKNSYLASSAFSRFPQWMWRNAEVLQFCRWLREYNASRAETSQVGFYGLDLYSMYTSIDEVLKYLAAEETELEQVAREQYACLEPWRGRPQAYGEATVSRRFIGCEQEVLGLLQDLLAKRSEYKDFDGGRYFNAVQNARVVANAESYYRVMYHGAVESWNLRDSHMFQTLLSLLEYEGEDARAVVWAHNSHLGDASATEMGRRGEYNVGELCRRKFGQSAYLVGFGTDHGTVACASSWGGELEIKDINPAHKQSHEHVYHESGIPRFIMPIRSQHGSKLYDSFAQERLERAIGVIYRPDTELLSHYFPARLAEQFDEYIWLDQTQAIKPIEGKEDSKPRETYPFGL